MTDAPYDVAILGLGPVGCTAAILLAHAGLKVVAVERDKEVYKLPRAVNLDGEIVRAFQTIGLAGELVPILQEHREGDRFGFANSKREWLFGSEGVPFGANGWQPMNFFDQPEVEGFLRDTAVNHPNVTSFIGCEATGLEDNGEAVTLDFKDAKSGAANQVAAKYLLGCDGASSYVRSQLGSVWRDLGYNHDWLVVDVIAKEGNTLNNTTIQVCDPERIVTYVCTKDPYRRWEFKMNPGETREQMLGDEKIRSLIDPWTPRGTYDIRRAAVYQFHAATAETWSKGRVFIAGDAAHQTPPFLGQGMNAGMRDAVNIAWKIPMVLSGLANEALLDSYQSEREAHAHDLVDWAVSIGRLMEHLAATEAAERAGDPPPEMPEQLKSAGYGQGREAPPLRAGVVRLDQVSDTGSTGYMFSQPIVRDSAGKEFHLDELFGEGFAVVGKNQNALNLSAEGKAILKKLDAPLVSLEDLQKVRGHFDNAFENADAIIVRPDRYVFGHTADGVALDDLVSDLGRKLHVM